MNKQFKEKITDYVLSEIGLNICLDGKRSISGVSKLSTGTVSICHGTGDLDCWFIASKSQIETPGRIISVMKRIISSMTEKCPVIYVMEKGCSYEFQRAFHYHRMNIIVLDHMIQCPDLCTIKKTIPNSFYSRRIVSGRITPFAQCLLIRHMIYNDVSMSDADMISKRFGICISAVRRAIRWIVDKGLAKKSGKYICFPEADDAWRRMAISYMENPVNYSVCVAGRPQKMKICGVNGMEKYTMLSGRNTAEYACTIDDVAGLERVPENCGTLVNIWKYSPDINAMGDTVDPVSLWLTMKDDSDERVQKECEKLINDIYAQRI